MARYRLLEKTFINGMMGDKGDIVEFDGSPGTTLQPVETNSKVTIPDNWRDENGLKRIALARSLGAPKQRLSGAEADLWIQNELDNRELAKTEAKTHAKTEPAKPSLLGGLVPLHTDEEKAKREADDAAAKKAEADKHPVI